MMRMHPDIPCREGRTNLVGIEAPLGPLAELGGRAECPFLEVFHMDLPDPTDAPCPYHLADLPHHRMRRIGVGHGKDETAAFLLVDQITRLLQRVAERLVTDDVD